jgi:hypothetical protein
MILGVVERLEGAIQAVITDELNFGGGVDAAVSAFG